VQRTGPQGTGLQVTGSHESGPQETGSKSYTLDVGMDDSVQRKCNYYSPELTLHTHYSGSSDVGIPDDG
jgi:hypothetical protein